MAEHVAGYVETQAQDALDQREAGEEVIGQARVDASGDRQDRQGDAEENDEGERPDEVRHGEQDAVSVVDQRAGPGAAGESGENGGADAQHQRDGEGQQRQLDRRRQSIADEFHDVLPHRDRGAEVAAQGMLQPDHELLRDRLVQTVARPQPRNVGLAGARRDHHGDRIARHDAQEHEGHDGDAEQGDGGGERLSESGQGVHRQMRTAEAVRSFAVRIRPC